MRNIAMKYAWVFSLFYLAISTSTAQPNNKKGQVIEIERTTQKTDGTSEIQHIKIYKSNEGTISQISLNGEILSKTSGTYQLIVKHYIGTPENPGTIQVNNETKKGTDQNGNAYQQMRMTYGVTSYAEELITAEEKGGFLSDKLRKEMIKDGLVGNGSSAVSIVLTQKGMKINGVAQKDTIATKYRTLYENHTGQSLAEDDNIELFLVTNKQSY